MLTDDLQNGIKTLVRIKKSMKILIIFFTLFISLFINAQDFELIPFRIKNNWGFSDSNKRIIIQPKYESVLPFNNGFSAFKKNNKWGIINIKNIEIVQPKYDSVGMFFQSFTDFKNNGEMIQHDALSVTLNGDKYYVDTNGNKLNKGLLDVYEEDEPLKENFEILRKEKLVGIKFLKNNIIIAPEYDSIVFIESQSSDIKDYIFAKKNKLWAKVSIENNAITEFKYQSLKLPRKGFSQVLFKKGNKWGILDKNNIVILENVYDSIINIYSDYIVVKDNKWGVLDYQFNITIPLIYNHIKYNSDGYYVKNNNDKIGYIGIDGKLLIPMKYSYLKQCNGYQNSKIFKYQEKINSNFFGCLNIQNDLNIPQKYLLIDPIDNGFFLVKLKNGKTGYINSKNVEYFKN